MVQAQDLNARRYSLLSFCLGDFPFCDVFDDVPGNASFPELKGHGNQSAVRCPLEAICT